MKKSCWLAGLLLCPGVAAAHSFGVVYNLPVPFWLYAWGSAGALLLSFVVLGWFVAVAPEGPNLVGRDITDQAWLRRLRLLYWLIPLRLLALLMLVMCIVTGVWGKPSPYENFNMTAFWIVFLLGFSWLVALVGNLYAWINPWQTLAACVGRFAKGYRRGLLKYPEQWGCTPALLLYMGFIWLELFGETTPLTLAQCLVAYSVFNLLGAGLFGLKAWFRHVELFSVFMRLLGSMAPFTTIRDEAGRRRLYVRWPYVGVFQLKIASYATVLFILFMLSSTAFDGLHESQPWVSWYWVDWYSCVYTCDPTLGIAWWDQWVNGLQAQLQERFPRNPLAAFPALRAWYGPWQAFWLFASAFIYFAVFWLFCWLTKLAGRGQMPVRTLVLRFSATLLPIALVYHITHYYTLIQTQGVKIFPLASDPFGRGWDMLGTKDWFYGSLVPDPAITWHVQVGLIVFGHIVSVWLAHLEALKLFPTHRQAMLSQIPMLILMVLFTAVGLWILSLPLSASVGG